MLYWLKQLLTFKRLTYNGLLQPNVLHLPLCNSCANQSLIVDQEGLPKSLQVDRLANHSVMMMDCVPNCKRRGRGGGRVGEKCNKE